MNARALNNLWSYLQGLSLSDRDKRWLSNELIKSSRTVKHTQTMNSALLRLDGCWKNDDDSEELANAILKARGGRAREVAKID